MSVKAGVGYSENPKSRDAGIAAATAAMEQAGVATCDLVIMYSTEKHDPAQLHNGVRPVVGPRARVIGGYAVGIITRDQLGYEGHQVGVAVISSDSLQGSSRKGPPIKRLLSTSIERRKRRSTTPDRPSCTPRTTET